ncbi:AzlC family ABC transporter permease [Ancylobacter dichloromethanicus]|uniref:AzlC family ABC transporter permease n=1 Tax=Ancylobacter dichloromethanicus TaxID=518825 RepID=UPI001BCD23C6|nr:AzlC family ABC transporter permease [Ancylobacter dichloromethanicus]MBS7553865.1 AzlC family ABC transporter permease [Ancylobacter dichloromethanicus]
MAPASQPRPPGATLTAAGCWRGARAILAVLPPVFVFGVAFGIAARGVGIEGWVAALMSMAAFAGAAQFAVLDLWTSPVPWLPLLVATFAINARHILLGASLRGLCRGLPAWKVYGAMALLSDLNWAALIAAERRGERDLGYLVGGGALMWVTWVSATVIGAVAGGLTLDDVKTYALDLVLVAFFATTLVGLRRGRVDDLPWLVAGLAALGAVWFLPPNWHVMVGGLAGGLAGLIRDELKRP